VQNATAVDVGQADVKIPESPEVLIARWDEWMEKTKNLSPNTRKLYRRSVIVFAGDTLDFLNATEVVVQAWLQAQGGSSGTFCNRVSGLTSFYRWARKTKLIQSNPCDELDLPKREKRLPKPVENLEDALRALDTADERANEKGSQPRRVGETRDMAVFLCYTGLRIHEAVKCDWPTPCPAEAFVVGKGNKEELMQIPDKAREAWDRLGGRWPVGARATQRRFEKIGYELAFTPHQCRHWLATTLVRRGVEIGRVSKIMRHSNVQTTMGYSAYAKEQNREALDLLP
jgi:integrase/recombinase XerD